LLSLLLVYVTVAASAGVALGLSRVFWRQELQTINKRFEVRQWLVWSEDSLKRLNPTLLWRYHQEHEIPRQWWAWDYTLSWLIEHNHPPVRHKVIIFNHLLEDEPPAEAVAHHPWLQPLLHHPLPRAAVADMVEFLARSGARLIVLDNDFPQYTDDDTRLAEAIHKASSGQYGAPVPVLMARTVNRRSTGAVIELEVPSMPSGLLKELSKLEPGRDVAEKYTGTTGILPDEDQVVRRIALTLPGLTGQSHQSIALKALVRLGEKPPPAAPSEMDIDFVSPPNSDVYPVRPLSYLLDPERKHALVHPAPGSSDVTLPGAVVFIGDGVTDIYSTPFTNSGLNQMSGTEILVHALETSSRGRWPLRLQGWQETLYMLAVSLAGGLLWTGWKVLQLATMSSVKHSRLVRSSADLACLIAVISGSYVVACLVFAYGNVIVPVFVPSLALGMGTVGALLWERERERQELFQVKLDAAEERLLLANERYESDLKRQEAEARAREILMDRERRHEFVRRINHDLNAPVSVLNWTLSELQEEGLESGESKEKIGRLVKTSDKLCELIDQLVQSYDYEAALDSNEPEQVDLSRIMEESLDLQRPLAHLSNSDIDWSPPAKQLWVHGNELEISRMIDNIVRNAIKHNPAGTRVAVTMKMEGGEHRIEIADNGKGIAPEHLKHIFEPGYRVDRARADSQGLGLDIVKTLVERMGGHINVASTVGEGTTFTVCLPASSSTDEAPDNGAESLGDSRNGG
jgi:signal transduction histidine kinase